MPRRNSTWEMPLKPRGTVPIKDCRTKASEAHPEGEQVFFRVGFRPSRRFKVVRTFDKRWVECRELGEEGLKATALFAVEDFGSKLRTPK